MKIDELKKELSGLDVAGVRDKVNLLKKELYELKCNSSTAHIKDYSRFKKLRKNVARALTALHQKSQKQS